MLGDIIPLNYAILNFPTITALPKEAPDKELYVKLSGSMNRYVWRLDNKVVSEADKILIRKGENVRIILYNGSTLGHPCTYMGMILGYSTVKDRMLL